MSDFDVVDSQRVSEQALKTLAEAATPGPWRARRASLDADHPDEPPACWGIVAGKETWHRNKGHFHPEDEKYPVDEVTVVEISYDNDYYTPFGAIPERSDAEYIAAANPEVILALLARVGELEAERNALLEQDGHHLHSAHMALEKLAAAQVRVEALQRVLREVAEFDQDEWHVRSGWLGVEFLVTKAAAVLSTEGGK